MKSAFRKLIALVVLLNVLAPSNAQTQDLTGIWKGYFTTNTGEYYRLEFQILQNKKKTVTGVSYSYGDNINFYGKATMTGHVVESTTFTIQELKTVEVKSPGGMGTCIMNYRFTYSRSGNEEFLDGTYLGKEENPFPKRKTRWGDCGSGSVHLRRVTSSDFYVEPFLRDKPQMKDPEPEVIEKKPQVTEKKPTAKPPVKPNNKPVVVTKPPVKKRTPQTKPANTNTTAIAKTKIDTTEKKPVEQITSERTEQKPKIDVPATLRSGKNELTQTVTVTSEEINVRLYDNGEIDGDTISVYLDGKPIVTNKGLSTVPITLKLKMDEDSPEHTLVMVAENMGRIPPNTALMIVQDGDRRYQVGITSTEQKNAMVRFRYEKK
jgi:hypothetical protein